jgi:hypothetical protein
MSERGAHELNFKRNLFVLAAEWLAVGVEVVFSIL